MIAIPLSSPVEYNNGGEESGGRPQLQSWTRARKPKDRPSYSDGVTRESR